MPGCLLSDNCSDIAVFTRGNSRRFCLNGEGNVVVTLYSVVMLLALFVFEGILRRSKHVKFFFLRYILFTLTLR